MENVSVVISYSGNNFGAYVPLLPGCVATGNSPNEVRKNIIEAIDFHVESSIEDGDEIDVVFKNEYELSFHFDVNSLLNYYKGILTLSGLEKITGINQKQLQHYASGLKKPRKEQKSKIEDSLHNFGKELISLEL